MPTIYKPRLEDLWFREQLLSDAETMSYNRAWGGTISFPKEQWNEWYDHWVAGTDGKRYYRYIKNESGEFIGEIAYHYDTEIDGFIANVIVYAKFRGNGYGGTALDALCSAAKENGIAVLYDDIAIDNPAIGLFIRHGFSEVYRTKEKIVLKKEL
ncbi:MAG: GNAT family N-acetyltransferase [Clostridia bacterium]|nr:GNAT family N-acetyltransferase [Clostridia bacterium]